MTSGAALLGGLCPPPRSLPQSWAPLAQPLATSRTCGSCCILHLYLLASTDSAPSASRAASGQVNSTARVWGSSQPSKVWGGGGKYLQEGWGPPVLCASSYSDSYLETLLLCRLEFCFLNVLPGDAWTWFIGRGRKTATCQESDGPSVFIGRKHACVSKFE